MNWKTPIFAAFACLALVACDPPPELPSDPPPIGDFRLAHLKVSAQGTEFHEISRIVEESALEESLYNAIQERLGRHKGNKWYHINVAIEGVILAPPGIPVVASLKSVMIIRVQVWDDAQGIALNDPPKEFTIIEPYSSETVVGSGITRDEQEQLTAISRHAAATIEDWLKSFDESPLPSVNSI